VEGTRPRSRPGSGEALAARCLSLCARRGQLPPPAKRFGGAWMETGCWGCFPGKGAGREKRPRQGSSIPSLCQCPFPRWQRLGWLLRLGWCLGARPCGAWHNGILISGPWGVTGNWIINTPLRARSLPILASAL